MTRIRVQVGPAVAYATLDVAAARAGLGTVGYRGGPLTTLTPGTALPAEWQGDWYGTALVIRASNITLDRVWLPGSIDCYGTNLTLTGCKVTQPAGAFWGVNLRHGTLTATDTTVTGAGGGLAAFQSSGPARLVRCDASGFEDGIVCSGASLIDTCCIHDLDHDDGSHVDGIQYYGGSGCIVRHCWIDVRGPHSNAAFTINGVGMVLDDCYLAGGVWVLRGETPGSAATVTNNQFGPLEPGAAGEVAVPSSMVATWSNNRRSNGSLIPKP